ncbi:hypothetical protein HaLaN_20390 [Haematococcus lacustris]|uniref:Uncharacterized protein n=1 Tax=Haematococcus lacustris TaxID=44745 RepID=A0A699ZX68_HAELA|nr:hypothetical protein HaLaN_20390 [Haematococcus lacustris]
MRRITQRAASSLGPYRSYRIARIARSSQPKSHDSRTQGIRPHFDRIWYNTASNPPSSYVKQQPVCSPRPSSHLGLSSVYQQQQQKDTVSCRPPDPQLLVSKAGAAFGHADADPQPAGVLLAGASTRVWTDMVFKLDPSSRLLLCAPSNSAADLLAQRVMDKGVSEL